MLNAGQALEDVCAEGRRVLGWPFAYGLGYMKENGLAEYLPVDGKDGMDTIENKTGVII